MKKALRLISVYLLVLILGILVGALIHMTVLYCKTMVAGGQNEFFSLSFFLRGCFVSIPIVSVFSLLVLLWFSMRNCIHGMFPFLLFLLFSLITWLIIVPLSIVYVPSSELSISEREKPLACGIFREENEIPYFYLNANESEGYRVLKIDSKTLKGSPVIEIQNHNPSRTFYADPILVENLAISRWAELFDQKVSILYSIAKERVLTDKVTYLCMASVGLAILGLWFFSGLAAWKTINFVLVTACFLIILNVNARMYEGDFLTRTFFLIQRFINIPSDMEKYIPVLINTLLFLCTTIVGSLIGIHCKKGNGDTV